MESLHKTKKLIIETALKLFSKNGYEKTTISAIITKTKLSKGAVYHHFKSKEEITITAIELMWKELRVEYDKIIAEKIPAILKLQKIITAEEILFKGKEKALIAIVINSRDSEIRKQIMIANEKYFFPPLLSIITQGKNEKNFKIENPILVTYFIMSLSESMYLLPENFLHNKKNFQEYTTEYMNAISRILGINDKEIKTNYRLN